MPAALERKPDIPEHLLFVWDAFGDLNTDRQIGFDEGPIMWSSIDRYAQRVGIIDGDEFERFAALIRAMDNTKLKWLAERAKSRDRNKADR